MGIENRPYVGTWQLGRQRVVQHTPDALVYVNGDVTVPGCPKCNGRIDIQKFLTEVSVDAGTDPGGASASFTMSLPVHHHNSFARDAQFIFRPGLEVHVYMRGYFPTKGLYKNLAEPRVNIKVNDEHDHVHPPEEPDLVPQDGKTVEVEGFISKKRRGKATVLVIHESGTNSRSGTEKTLQRRGLGVHYAVSSQGVNQYLDNDQVTAHTPGLNNNSIGIEFVHNTVTARQGQQTIDAPWAWKKKYAIPSQTKLENLWKTVNTVTQDTDIALQFPGADGGKYTFGTGSAKSNSGCIAHQHHGGHQDGAFPVLYMTLRQRGYSPSDARSTAITLATGATGSVTLPPRRGASKIPSKPNIVQRNPSYVHRLEAAGSGKPGLSDRAKKGLGLVEGEVDDEAPIEFEGLEIESFETQPSVLELAGLGGSGIEDVLAYPYYQVFHGVVTSVSHAWSGGVNTVSVQCASMLHFWQYHTISTNASVFGARPKEGKLRTSMVGHNFTGMHPYQILYTLHHDMVGSAGGVAWNLSQKTNQTAKSEVAGESLFSLNIKYWRRRFNSEMVKLRLHGASGELFNTAQSAFLASTSSANLTKVLRKRHTKIQPGKRQAKGILEQSVTVGFSRRNKAEALVQSRQRQANTKNSPKFEINLIEMQAFVSNISNWGQVNLFESTYESKLDIANKVAEVTGFEFYQDVDGDLVFKPPMYNLDTSSSRVYRIEDIDIISINFDEKEPEVTYMTMKNAHFKNLGGTGVDGEWGVRGQYIDYRLVAKFGWRPSDFETSYLNNRRALFFAAVNRLDILNAPSNSASLTIPIRPELRPGYPVYIPYLDAFYYCSSFAHSYSVGGQCTTSMQLIAKRAKFFAPGKVGATSRGIESIDLKNTILPQRPLGIVGKNELPRLAGFPNVVMALDAEAINPLFFVVGADLDRIDNPQVLKNLLSIGEDLGLVTKDPVTGNYLIKVQVGSDDKGLGESKEVLFSLQDKTVGKRRGEGKKSNKSRGGKGRKTADKGATKDSPINLLDAAIAYQKKKQEWSGEGLKGKQAKKAPLRVRQKAINDLRSEISGGNDEITRLVTALNDESDDKKRAQINEKIERLVFDIEGTPSNRLSSKQKRKAKTRKAALKGQLLRLEEAQNALAEEKKNFDRDLRNSEKDGVAHLLGLLDAVGEEFLSKNEEYADLNSTVNLLDMLSDKKASFSGSTQPGSYRYYSASHPDPDQQGMKRIIYEETQAGEKGVTLENSFLEPRFRGTKVEGFLPSRQITRPRPGAPKPEAQLGPITVQRGIQVLTGNPAAAKGEVLPTSEIKELMFSVQRATFFLDKKTTARPATINDLGNTALAGCVDQFVQSLKTRTAQTLLNLSVEDLFIGVWDKQEANIKLGVDAVRKVLTVKPTKKIFPDFPRLEFPLIITPQGGESVSTRLILFGFQLRGNDQGEVAWGKEVTSTGSIAFADAPTVSEAATEAAQLVGEIFFIEINRARRSWVADASLRKFSVKEINKGLTEFNTFLSQTWGVEVSAQKAKKGVKQRVRQKQQDLYSPVFPVSDAGGYEVIGSYRYGRGVSIEPSNVFRGLHFQDPLLFLDRRTIEEVLDVFVRGNSSREVQVPRRDKNGKALKNSRGEPLFDYFKGAGGRGELDKKVLDQLRRNLTDKQIIDLIGVDTNDPDQLHLGMANYFADKGRDGIQKLPVINTALSLADLTFHSDSRVCACKAREADILLEAFSDQDFIKFVKPGSSIPQGFGGETPDQATQWLTQVTALASTSWAQSQAALRGEVLDRGGSSVIKALGDFGTAVTQGAQQEQNRAKDALIRTAKAAADDVSTVGDQLAEFEKKVLSQPGEG